MHKNLKFHVAKSFLCKFDVAGKSFGPREVNQQKKPFLTQKTSWWWLSEESNFKIYVCALNFGVLQDAFFWSHVFVFCCRAKVTKLRHLHIILGKFVPFWSIFIFCREITLLPKVFSGTIMFRMISTLSYVYPLPHFAKCKMQNAILSQMPYFGIYIVAKVIPTFSLLIPFGDWKRQKHTKTSENYQGPLWSLSIPRPMIDFLIFHSCLKSFYMDNLLPAASSFVSEKLFWFF